ncbi:MAG: antitoxin [SAR324 cluster bacterium]|nr:antitoxin [SAR324 cluster bacterium]
MKNKLDTEEQEILDAFEHGKLKSIPNSQTEIKLAQQAARNTFNKNKRVNLRLTERDFELAHVKALKEGLPYQTLLASIIHKYLTGQLIETI